MKKTLFILLAMATLASAVEYGNASFYSIKSNGGVATASGERLSDSKLTAAHKTLPFGTVVEVKCVKTGKSVKVKINDNGPHIKGRIIDLSKAAAQKLGMTNKGIIKVEVSVVSLGKKRR
jgi:rare lipoprotein A